MSRNYINISITFLMCVVSLNFYAQDSVIDSLKLALKNTKQDTVKCAIYIALGEELYQAKPDSSINLWLKVLVIANDKLKKLSNNSFESKILKQYQASALNDIGFVYDYIGNINKSIEYYEKSLKIREEIGDKSGMAESLNNIGYLFYSHGVDMFKAIKYYEKSYQLLKEIGEKKEMALLLNNIGAVYNNQGDIAKALEFYLQSLKISESINDRQGIALLLNNIGVLYSSQGQKDKAFEFYQKSLKLRVEINDKSGISKSLNSLGDMMALKNNLPKAIEYYNNSMKICEEINDNYGVALSLNNLGIIYNRIGIKDKALECYFNSLKIQQQISDKQGESLSLNNISAILVEQGKLSDALKYALKSLQISKELGYPEDIKHSSATLKQIYIKQKKYKQAVEMFELEIQMRDSINNDVTKKAAIKKQFQYEYEKQAAADSVKHAEEQKVKNAQLTAQAASLKQEQTQRYALYGGLFLVLGFSVFVFNRFRVTQKQKKIIEEQKILVDKAYESLHEKNKEVMDSIYYARRIQRALVTSEKYIDRTLNKLNKKS